MNVPQSPMRALFWKEWRGLRHLRYACVALGALLPLFFFAGAAMGRSGLSPFGSVSGWSATTILREAVPGVLAIALWPFTALLMIAQAYSGDRAAGTEAFLLERPVARRRVWFMRLTASSLSAATVVVGTASIWALWVVVGGGVGPQGWKEPLTKFALGGMILLLVTPCAMLAASLLASPLLAVLASALFAALPAVLSTGLGSYFPYVGWGPWPFGAVIPWLMVPLYLAVSYLVTCTGEPAGRDRLGRGVASLAISLIIVAFAFVSVSQARLRYESRLQNGAPDDLEAAPRGDRVLLRSSGNSHLWLVDTQAARVLEDYPGPLGEAAWRGDGEMFAFMTCSGPLGSRGRCRIGFFDRDGNPAATPWYASSDAEIAYRLQWYGSRLTFIVSSAAMEDATRIFFEPGKGEVGPMRWPRTEKGVSFIGMLWDGSAAVERILPQGGADRDEQTGDDSPVTHALYRFDLEKGVIDPNPLFEETIPRREGDLRFSLLRGHLSPSGRWWRRRTDDAGRPLPPDASSGMVDLMTGRVVQAPQEGWPDDPVRHFLQQDGDATALMEEGPDRPAKKIGSWSGVQVEFRASPDSRYLLVRLDARKEQGEPEPNAPDTWFARYVHDLLYDTKSGVWTPLPPAPPAIEGDYAWPLRRWASSRTLIFLRGRSIVLEDAESPERYRFLVGGR